jgi:uncharacterized protein
MYHHWNWITFLHWRYPPAIVQRLLPPELTAETFDGTAWIGLTPFLMEGIRPPVLPAMPWLSRFGEINVRTYVHDGHGRSGIWFFSLDAARLPAVAAARAGYWLPYFWSDVSARVTGDRIAYRCHRRYPAGRAQCDAVVTMGPRLAEAERDELAHFLTARYRLFTMIAGRLAAAEAEHPPWPLRQPRCSAWTRTYCNAQACRHRPATRWLMPRREYQCGSACGTGDRTPHPYPREAMLSTRTGQVSVAVPVGSGGRRRCALARRPSSRWRPRRAQLAVEVQHPGAGNAATTAHASRSQPFNRAASSSRYRLASGCSPRRRLYGSVATTTRPTEPSGLTAVLSKAARFRSQATSSACCQRPCAGGHGLPAATRVACRAVRISILRNPER